MPGEAMHHKGADGARRAKRWLDSTTRVIASWTNEDTVHASRLEFAWPENDHQPFSLDVGGILSGSPFEGEFFMAECKKYEAGAADQGKHYDDYVSKCYVVRRDHPRLADHFMWITWHPFRVGEWVNLCTEKAIRTGLLVERNRARVFGTVSEEDAAAKIDSDLVEDVARRLWMIVLSDKQEDLVITPAHRALIVAQQVEQGIR